MNKIYDFLKEKKLFLGFTLVEMISTIIVLSIIALIVYPTISRIIVNNKIKAYEQQIEVIKEAAANWLTTNEDKLKDNSYPLPIKDILAIGLIEENKLTNPIDNETIDGCILITWRKNIKQYAYNYTDNCDDFVIPKLLSLNTSTTENEYGWRNKDFYITLNGTDLENYYYCINDNKCEPNVLVNDINESILFNEEGIKYVCAYGINKSGETEEICEKYKLDKTNPTIGTIVFSGTKGLNDWYVSDVNVSITESIDSLSGIVTNELYPNTTKITTDTKGITYKLTAKDKAGNISETSYTVKVDKTIPNIGELVINGTKGNNDWYISDLTFSVVNGSDSISEHLSTTSSIDSITNDTKGTKVVLTTMNKAGLTSTKEYNFKMDKTAPIVGELVINGTKGNNDWYTSDLTFSVVNGSDSISGHSSTKSSLNSLTTETSGTTVTITTTNNAGLTSTKDYIIKMDKTKPTAGTATFTGTLGSNNWYTSNVTVNVINGSDSLSGHNTTTSNITSITSNTSGTTVTITTTDKAGNTSTRTYNKKVDKTKPTLTAKKSSSTIKVGTNNNTSTYFNTSYSISGGSLSCNPTTTGSLSIGTHTLTCTATGGNGLTTTATTSLVVESLIPSTPTVVAKYTNSNGGVYDNTWTNKSIYFELSPGSSYDQITSYQYKLGTGSWQTPSDLSLNSNNGNFTYKNEVNNTLYIRACNSNGCSSQTQGIALKIDKTAPTAGTLTFTGTKGSNGWYTSNVSITVNNGSDSLSGHDATFSDYSMITSETKGTVVTVYTYDNAGNESSREYTIKVDKTKPSIWCLAYNATMTHGGHEITLEYDSPYDCSVKGTFYSANISASSEFGLGVISASDDNIDSVKITSIIYCDDLGNCGDSSSISWLGSEGRCKTGSCSLHATGVATDKAGNTSTETFTYYVRYPGYW